MTMKSAKERFHVARSAPDRPAGTDLAPRACGVKMILGNENHREAFIRLKCLMNNLKNMKQLLQNKADAGVIKNWPS